MTEHYQGEDNSRTNFEIWWSLIVTNINDPKPMESIVSKNVSNIYFMSESESTKYCTITLPNDADCHDNAVPPK